MKKTAQKKIILRELEDGLILRRSNKEDTQALFDFNSGIHSDDGPEKPDERIGAWAQYLLSGDHPTFGLGDFTIVEESTTGKIVSSMNLISQTWAYEGITFKVGRPEMVGTLPEYRNRGLVRMQFDVIHQWSQERGELLQAITGIPFYYRLFGYEMALNLGGGRAGYKPQLPKLKENEEEFYTFRPVEETDISFIESTYHRGSQRYPIRCMWDQETLSYEIMGKSSKNINRVEFRIIETREGEAVGFLAHPAWNWDSMMPVVLYELKSGISYGAVTPSVARYLYRTGEAIAKKDRKEDFNSFGFWLGSDHPVYQVMKNRLPNVRKPYAWYMRVADVPAFIRHITPALETRLATSPYAGHTAELKITFYKDGIRLGLEKGRIVTVENYKPEPVGGAGDAGFPSLTFLQLLFGYRSLEELRFAFADCWTENDDVTGLLEAMFPKRYSDVWAVS